MKRFWRTLLIVLAVLVLILAGLAYWQRDNIHSFLQSQQYSVQELEEQINETQQRVQQKVEETPELVVRDLTDEEKQALDSGEMTEEELIERLIQPTVPEDGTQAKPQKPSETAGKEPTVPTAQPETPQQAYQREISTCIAKVYVLRERFASSLAGLEASAKKEYSALPKEKRNATGMASIIQSYIAKAQAMEVSCDSQIGAIISEMDAIAEKYNGDPTLSDTVFEAYLEEKSLKKAYYLSKLQ